MQFKHIVLGGTFDHIHKGHEALLTKAYAVGKQVAIGLTTDWYVREVKSQKSKVNSYEERKKQLKAWLKKQGIFRRTIIVPIDDSYGPSITSRKYDAIVVSEETEKVAKKINSKRNELHLLPLAIIVVPMILAEDTEAISSTRILNGEIDHTGKLILPEFLRKTLTKPIGTVIADGTPVPVFSKDKRIISVGDTTTATLLSQGIIPTLACIDFQVRRQAFDWEKGQWQKLTKGRRIAYFSSGPGFISSDVMDAMRHWSENPKRMVYIIDGEEDLLVLPAIIFAPIGSVVYYGQPDQGIVKVKVTKRIKQISHTLLSQFTFHT